MEHRSQMQSTVVAPFRRNLFEIGCCTTATETAVAKSRIRMSRNFHYVSQTPIERSPPDPDYHGKNKEPNSVHIVVFIWQETTVVEWGLIPSATLIWVESRKRAANNWSSLLHEYPLSKLLRRSSLHEQELFTKFQRTFESTQEEPQGWRHTMFITNGIPTTETLSSC